jgi:hypothetical protein
VDTSSPGPEAGRAPQPPAPGGPAGGGGEMIAIPRDADRDDDVDVLYLAGQLPSDDGEWLLVSEAGGLPGAAFTVRCLPRDAWHAHGGDVLVRLQPDTSSTGQPAVLAGVWAVLGGHLILAGTWNRQEPEEWPERIRPAVAFAMGMVTELEEHDADLGVRHRVRLAAADTATAGVPLGVTSGRVAIAEQPGG